VIMALNMTNMVKAPIRFEVTLKPVGMSSIVKHLCSELVYPLTAANRDAAAQIARDLAAAEGFKNFAVTKVQEVKQ
jgi:hypothetical protein